MKKLIFAVAAAMAVLPALSQTSEQYVHAVQAGRREAAKTIAAQQDIAVVGQALRLYRLDNGRYPTAGQGLHALVKKPDVEPVPSNWKEGGYIERLPNDPWGHPYRYRNPGVHSDVDVYSTGGAVSRGEDGHSVVGSWE